MLPNRHRGGKSVDKPLISVIIPVYNVENYLDRCLESVVNQTYKNLEIILVDDGSPDNCPKMCDEWAKRDERIKVIHKAENSGVSSARNEGIEFCGGTWLAFIDSDDWIDSEFFAELMNQIGNEDCDIFVLSGYIKESKDNPEIKRGLSEIVTYSKKDEIEIMMVRALISPKYEITYPVISSPWNKLYRTDFVKSCYGYEQIRFDKTLCAWEDAFFNFNLFSYAKVIKEGTYIGYHYRIVNESISHGYDANRPQTNRRYREKLYSYMKNHAVNDVLRQGIYGGIITSAASDLRLCHFHPNNKKSQKQIRNEVKKLKSESCVYEAVHGKSNAGYDYKRLAVKYLLRQPLIWPVKMIFKIIY